eukprot:Skav206618  [mRNA]  locus=scaffold1562:252905:254914:+ [translate_table: standard]
MACQRRWDQRALLHVELAQCLHGSEKAMEALRDGVDQALRELNEAQKLWPSCPDALLLLAQIYADTLQLPEARLAAAQCHAALGSSGSKMLKDCQKVLQELQVSGQEAVLPQNYFANLFEQLIDLTNDDRATGSSDLGPMREFVAAVEVKGSSLREVNGVYEPSRVISNHFAVFQNSYGFRMSLETMSRKGAESDSVRGWVIGKDRVGFFRTAQVAENGLPSGEWTCFPAASGSTAPSGTSSKLSRIEDAILQVHAARLAGSSCSAVTASAVACLKLWRGPYEDLWKAAFVLTELAGLFRQHGLHQRALEVVSKALELCPSHWEAYLEVACIHDDLGESSQAILPLQQLLTARPTDGRAASMLLQLSKDLKDKEFDAWLKDHRDIPLVAEALASHDSSKPQGKDVDGPEVGADFQLEDQKEEVHAHWTLPRDIISKDLDVKFRQDWLQVQVKGQLLFEAELAHQIQPADSSWTFSSPHLTVMLSKCPVDGKWPRWEVLHKEDPASRLQRLGGLPFDRNAIRWF